MHSLLVIIVIATLSAACCLHSPSGHYDIQLAARLLCPPGFGRLGAAPIV
jgi:hypothetical protein